MELLRVSRENGEWETLILQWEAACEGYGESLEEYATASIPALRPLAEQTQLKNSGVYALRDDSGYHAMCQMNVTPLPGYDAPVLRIRHLVHSPRFDFDEQVGLDEWQTLLSSLLIEVYAMSKHEMMAPYIKFHFRSPTEGYYYQELSHALRETQHFESAELRGSWLYIKKKG